MKKHKLKFIVEFDLSMNDNETIVKSSIRDFIVDLRHFIEWSCLYSSDKKTEGEVIPTNIKIKRHDKRN